MKWTLIGVVLAFAVPAHALTFDCRYDTSTAFDYQGSWRPAQSREDFVATYSNIDLQAGSAKVTGNSGTANAVVFRGHEGLVFIERRAIGEILTKVWISDGIPEMLAVQLRPQSLNGRVASQTLHGRCNLRR